LRPQKRRPFDSQFDSGHGLSAQPEPSVRRPVKKTLIAASFTCAATVDFPAELVPPLGP
jgi:hypothetical protein